MFIVNVETSNYIFTFEGGLIVILLTRVVDDLISSFFGRSIMLTVFQLMLETKTLKEYNNYYECSLIPHIPPV